MLQQPYNCLFIAPLFFGYAQEIQAGLLRRGMRAMLFDDRPADDTLTKSLIRISPRLLKRKADEYFERVLREAAQHPIEEVLVIKGQALSIDAIRRLRASFPKARFTLYFWDSYRNMSSDTPDKVALFDRAFTFDPHDAQADSRLQYRPLFYLDEYAHLPNVDPDIDVFFFGTIHTDRYRVLKDMMKALPDNVRVTKILYFPSPLLYWARRIFDPSFWRAHKSEFIFSPVGKSELQALLARSRVVVDIERPVQSGLTIRTLEAVGAHKKLITTNSFARRADIYRPENVLVIHRDAIRIPKEFFTTEFISLPADVAAKYSLAGWLADIFPERLPTGA